jgi:hypothetical protein
MLCQLNYPKQITCRAMLSATCITRIRAHSMMIIIIIIIIVIISLIPGYWKSFKIT